MIIVNFVLTIFFIAALLVLLGGTLTVAYKRHLRMRDGFRGKGGILGIAFVVGEVFAILELALDGLYYGRYAFGPVRSFK
jgi:hypothetical protein